AAAAGRRRSGRPCRGSSSPRRSDRSRRGGPPPPPSPPPPPRRPDGNSRPRSDPLVGRLDGRGQFRVRQDALREVPAQTDDRGSYLHVTPPWTLSCVRFRSGFGRGHRVSPPVGLSSPAGPSPTGEDRPTGEAKPRGAG